MKHTSIILVTAMLATAALATTAVCKGDKDKSNTSNRQEFKEVSDQTFDVGKGSRLSLSNLNGPATITGWDKNSIAVKATKRARSEKDLELAVVTFDMKNGHLRIEVEYEDELEWREGRFASVEFEIQVPRDVEIDHFELVNGGIDLSNLTGDIQVSSVNGSIDALELSGRTQLSTVNGDVTLESSKGHDDIELSSVNGSVTLFLPGTVNAKISASTVHGDIRGDLGNGVTHAGNSMDAVLGSGGPRIELGTVNGDIRIRRAGSSARGESDHDSD